MNKLWNYLLFAVAVSFLIYLGTVIVSASFSDKETKRYRLETDTENGSVSGKVLRYRIVEEKEYSSRNYIVLPDSCDIYDAIAIQKDLNSQLKTVR